MRGKRATAASRNPSGWSLFGPWNWVWKNLSSPSHTSVSRRPWKSWETCGLNEPDMNDIKAAAGRANSCGLFFRSLMSVIARVLNSRRSAAATTRSSIHFRGIENIMLSELLAFVQTGLLIKSSYLQRHTGGGEMEERRGRMGAGKGAAWMQIYHTAAKRRKLFNSGKKSCN